MIGIKNSEETKLDVLFFEAAKLFIETGQSNASFLQRQMCLGFARTEHLIAQLVNNGVISELNSENQRVVLITVDELERLKKVY